MSILLTGGTGKSGSHLARLLHEASKPFLVASRDPTKVPRPYQGIKFDWFDEHTWNSLPFEGSKDPIRGVYLILPLGPNETVEAVTKNFIDFAIKKGVKRFALVSSSSVKKGQPGIIHGTMHAFLDEVGAEYCSLRPSWFMENFVHIKARHEPGSSTIYSATEDGKIPFVATEDIAQAAFDVLTSPGPMPTELFIVGPELLTYDGVATIMSIVTGRPMRHIRLSAAELLNRFVEQGLPIDFARPLVDMDVAIAGGQEEEVFYETSKFVGKVDFKNYAERSRDDL